MSVLTNTCAGGERQLEGLFLVILVLLIPAFIIWDTAMGKTDGSSPPDTKMRSKSDFDPIILNFIDQTYSNAIEIEKGYALALAEFSEHSDEHIQIKKLREVFLLKLSICEHIAALSRRLSSAIKTNDYGAVERDNRIDEVQLFFKSIEYSPRLLDFNTAVNLVLSEVELHKNSKKEKGFDVKTLPKQDAFLFEQWTAESLKKFGWLAKVTKASGDDGVDVVAVQNGLSVAVQCKLYRGSVGNKAVQEVYSGMKHMQLDRAVVISTGQYTKAAQNLASTTGVLLLSEHDIPHLWDLLNT